jgi:hypothetical protein
VTEAQATPVRAVPLQCHTAIGNRGLTWAAGLVLRVAAPPRTRDARRNLSFGRSAAATERIFHRRVPSTQLSMPQRITGGRAVLALRSLVSCLAAGAGAMQGERKTVKANVA